MAKQIVDDWMDSSGHRENILDAHHTMMGLGVVITDDEQVYATQNFC